MDLISFKIVGIDKVLKSLGKRHEKLKNNKSAFAACVIETDKWTQDNFRSEGGQVGGWAPLKQATIASRRHGPKKNNSTKILQDTGFMKNNWKSLWNNNNGYFQSMTDYAQVHNSGSVKKNIPKRQIIPTKEQMKDTFRKIFKLFVQKALS